MTEAPTRSQLTAWRNALFVIFAACGVALASWAARIPAVGASLGLDTAQVGTLLFGIAAGSIAGLVASGHLVATFGTRAVMVWSIVAAPLGLAAAAIAVTNFRSFAGAFVCLILFGAALGACDVAMNVSGAANEQALGRNVMPVYHAFFSTGTIVGAALGALAEGLAVPLSAHLAVMGVFILASGIFATRFLVPELGAPGGHRVEGEDHSTTWRSRLSAWKDPRTLLIGLIVLGAAFTEGSANDWLSYAMVHGRGADRATGALVLAVFVAAMTIGRLAGVRLLDRFGRVPVLRACASLAAIGLLVFILVPIAWVSVVGVVLWGFGASLGFPVGMSAAADDPRRAAARVSAVATIGYLAFLVGPPVIGYLGNAFGILNGLVLVLVLAGLAGAVAFAAREPGATARVTPAETPNARD